MTIEPKYRMIPVVGQIEYPNRKNEKKVFLSDVLKLFEVEKS